MVDFLSDKGNVETDGYHAEQWALTIISISLQIYAISCFF